MDTAKHMDTAGLPEGMSAWVSEVQGLLEAGRTVAFAPRGMSMWPTLRPASDMVYIEPRQKYYRMDMVLAVADNPKGVFLHRVVRAEGDRYVLMGDANLYQTEECTRQSILGKVVRIRRGEQDVTSSPSTRLLRAMHRLPGPLRRLLVRILIRIGR